MCALPSLWAGMLPRPESRLTQVPGQRPRTGKAPEGVDSGLRWGGPQRTTRSPAWRAQRTSASHPAYPSARAPTALRWPRGGQRELQGALRQAPQAADGQRRARPHRLPVDRAPGGMGVAVPTAARKTLPCNVTASCRSRAAVDTRSTTSSRRAARATRSSATPRSRGWLRRKRLDERAFLVRWAEVNAGLCVAPA